MNQFHPEHTQKMYHTFSYLQKRWFSYWYQIKEVHELSNAHTVLEIGPGNMIVTHVLRKMGYEVTTADLDPNVRADINADVRTITSATQQTYDVILCCQILEHIPFEDFSRTVRNLSTLSKHALIITLPYTSLGTFKPFVHLKLLPFLTSLRWMRFYNLFPKTHLLNRHGGHYWEIGKKTYPLSRIMDTIEQSGWNIKKHYPIFENPYHYLFVCEKQ